MGDVTHDMREMEFSRPLPLMVRTPVLVALTLALAVAGAVVALVFVTGRGSPAVSAAATAHRAAGHPGEIDLTALSSEQLRPVSARVDRSSVRVHPQVVQVAGVGTGDFTTGTEAESGSASSAAAQAPSDAQVRAELAAFRHDLRSGPGVPVGAAAGVQPDGSAVAPVDAPNVVAAVIQAGNAIASTPYKWGGGHGAWADTGYDCSGSVSFALAGAGLLSSPLDSTGFERWGAAGPGRWITVYANAGHAFMVVAGLRFDTSGRSGPLGTRWQPAMRSTAGFVARHPPGL
jgi:cell wall-associated NlpC family hydrolase